MSAFEQLPTDCLICRKHRGEVSAPGGAIYQDDLVYAGHAHIPEGPSTAYLGYLMAEPKRHTPDLVDPMDAAAFGFSE